MVTMQSLTEAPPYLESKDKFMVQSTIVPIGTTKKDIAHAMFSKHGGKYVEEKKLRIILARLPVYPVTCTETLEFVSPEARESRLRELGIMTTELLEINPTTLKFTIAEWKKQSSCSIQLINKTNQNVAFKIHGCLPNYLLNLWPVTMQSVNNGALNFRKEHKFLIQSTVLPLGTSVENIPSDMFSKHSTNYIEEKKLSVVHILVDSMFLPREPEELKSELAELTQQNRCPGSNELVKTSSVKMYCVRPNVGIIEPKATCNFTVTRQYQTVAPPNLECKDKFLVQSRIVPFGTTGKDITANMVVLVSPPHSLALHPDTTELKKEPNHGADNISPPDDEKGSPVFVYWDTAPESKPPVKASRLRQSCDRCDVISRD
ncbi:hypothetical protein Tsubulata_018302 [Turnera subulata]|uniref:MSP domain-containing protein n=1 Tax=Turnera subulata TaxID=218843 RepID=A0A9Q0JKU6_9ROSI|nr:hypothetical protein Tsubulata_018302 [Turnera subulata]